MPITWSDLRQKVRRSILSDTDVDANWTDEQLLDCLHWALDKFCTHTAYVSRAELSLGDAVASSDSTVEFPLPADLFEDLENTALIAVIDSSGASTYLEPIEYRDNASLSGASEGYYVIGAALVVRYPLRDTDTLRIDYFAHYPDVLDETDLIPIPRWAQLAVCYQIGLHAMTAASVRSGNINQWKNKDDSGNPEHNAFRAQQKWFFTLYESELARFAPQDRTNYWK